MPSLFNAMTMKWFDCYKNRCHYLCIQITLIYLTYCNCDIIVFRIKPANMILPLSVQWLRRPLNIWGTLSSLKLKAWDTFRRSPPVGKCRHSFALDNPFRTWELWLIVLGDHDVQDRQIITSPLGLTHNENILDFDFTIQYYRYHRPRHWCRLTSPLLHWQREGLYMPSVLVV